MRVAAARTRCVVCHCELGEKSKLVQCVSSCSACEVSDSASVAERSRSWSVLRCLSTAFSILGLPMTAAIT